MKNPEAGHLLLHNRPPFFCSDEKLQGAILALFGTYLFLKIRFYIACEPDQNFRNGRV